LIVWEGERARVRPSVRAWRALSPYAGFALFVAVILFLVFVVQN
jgi:hypothetical protein